MAGSEPRQNSAFSGFKINPPTGQLEGKNLRTVLPETHVSHVRQVQYTAVTHAALEMEKHCKTLHTVLNASAGSIRSDRGALTQNRGHSVKSNKTAHCPRYCCETFSVRHRVGCTQPQYQKKCRFISISCLYSSGFHLFNTPREKEKHVSVSHTL